MRVRPSGRLTLALSALLVALGVMFAPLPAMAQQIIDSYSTFIGPNDHYNSSGVRLTEAGQIIQQDRANVHRFGLADPGDSWDSVFGDANKRAQIPQLLRRGSISSVNRRLIVNSNVSVWVEIYGVGSRPQYITVQVVD